MSDALARLFRPRTIAVIGGRECERVIEQSDKLGFAGTIWAVHPKRETMGGRSCFASVTALPEPPDVAYVAVNRETTINVVRNLAAMGCGGAVCYAAGFAEADGQGEGFGDLQAALLEAAGNMPLIGPNCYGFINALDRVALWPDQHGLTPVKSGAAIIAQSSNLAINLTMQARGLPIAMALTVGNQASIGMSAMARSLLEDDRITAIGLHIEGLDDVKAFEAFAMAARKAHKPVVALKVGRSEQAVQAALTHTASLAGSDKAHQALFKRLGIARAKSVEGFLETLKLLHCGGPLESAHLLSLSCSGGEASLMADAGEGKAVTFRPFAAPQAAAVKKVLGDLVTIANPLDYNTYIWGDWPAMTALFRAAMAPAFGLSMLVIDFPPADRCDDADWRGACGAFVEAVREDGPRAAIVCSLPENLPIDLAVDLVAAGIAPLCGFDHALEAAEAAAFIQRAWNEPAPLPLTAPPINATMATNVLDEHRSKRALASAGVVVLHGMTVNAGEALAIPAHLQAPFALKALGIAHKTDRGGVHLNLKTTAAIEGAMGAMAPLSDHFLLEPMAPPPLCEMIVGVTQDPVCGLVMTIGAGGVLAELLDDTATLLLPAAEDAVREALAGLKIGRVLEGYRQSDAADIDALVANILCIARYAVAKGDRLVELDVNPLFASQFGSVAVDALIVERI
ncbi:MAG: acetate--CoA ligase family protein [Pseudomonadota bacterium]